MGRGMNRTFVVVLVLTAATVYPALAQHYECDARSFRDNHFSCYPPPGKTGYCYPGEGGCKCGWDLLPLNTRLEQGKAIPWEGANIALTIVSDNNTVVVLIMDDSGLGHWVAELTRLDLKDQFRLDVLGPDKRREQAHLAFLPAEGWFSLNVNIGSNLDVFNSPPSMKADQYEWIGSCKVQPRHK